MLNRLKTLPDFLAIAAESSDEAERAGRALALIRQQAPEVYTSLEERWRADAGTRAQRITQLRRRVARSIAVATIIVIASTALISTLLVSFVFVLLYFATVSQEPPGDAPFRALLENYRGTVWAGTIVLCTVVGSWLARRYYPFFISGELGELRTLQRQQAEPDEEQKQAFMLNDVTMLMRSVRS